MSKTFGFRAMVLDLTPLRTPAFRSLFISGIPAATGAIITAITIQQQIYTNTGSNSLVGLASLVMLIPVILFGLAGGAIADRFDRRKILLLTTTGLAASAAALAAVSIGQSPSIPAIIAIASTQQAFFAVNQPTRQAIVPRVVQPSELPAANTLLFTIFGISTLVGPMLAGILLATIPIPTIYLLELLTTIPMIVAIVKLPSVRPEPATGPNQHPTGLMSLLRSPLILSVLMLDLLVTVGLQPRALFPSLSADKYGGPVAGGIELGLLNSAAAVGVLVGALASGWLSRTPHLGRVMLASGAVGSLCVVGFAVSQPIWAGLAFLVVVGWTTMTAATARNTILQSTINDSVRGRAQGLLTVVTAAGPRIADPFHGVLADATTPSWAIVVGAALSLITVASAAILASKLMSWKLGK